MTYDPTQMVWITDKGNTLGDIDAHFHDMFRKAEELAWPVIETVRSVSELNGWGAQKVKTLEYIGKRPKFGEKRTIEALELLIDKQNILTPENE